MTDQTTGQRIAQCRKQLGLSQEALGEQVGVSRQAISKWESDATLPDIDKLIALSKLFSVSIGWLLGVEEESHSRKDSPQISEEMLRKIEEVVQHYQPRKKRLSKGKKALIGIAAVLVLWGALSLGRQWRDTRLEVAYLGAQIRNNNQQNSSILRQLDTLKDQIENINTTVEEAAASLASYSFDISPNIAEKYAQVGITVIPKSWDEDWKAAVHVRHSGALSVQQACHWDGTALNAALKLNLVDDLEYYLVISYPDGAQESVKLEDEQAQNLKKSCTILCELEPRIHGYRSDAKTECAELYFTMQGLSLHRPHPEENPGDWLWTRTDYVLYRTRDSLREEVGTSPILDLGQDAKVYEHWGTQEVTFPVEMLREGDEYELWVVLQVANGQTLEKCMGKWHFHSLDGFREVE